MIYDNPNCVSEAERLVERFAGNRVALVREIAGELNRYYALGKHTAISAMKRALERAEAKEP